MTLLERWDAVGAVLAEVRPDEIRQAIVDAERLRAELADAMREATIVAEAMEKQCGAVPEWKPPPDLVGVITHINNMVAGLRAKFVAMKFAYETAKKGQPDPDAAVRDERDRLRAENADLRRQLAEALDPTWPKMINEQATPQGKP